MNDRTQPRNTSEKQAAAASAVSLVRDRMIADLYRQEVKRFKLPRYLIQLESVGLLEETTISGKNRVARQRRHI